MPTAEAESILPADYRPPARMGSVLAACEAGARRIGLIDGYYESVPAVWHKEICYALSRGVEIFGAASMGALRAAELDGLGMIGVGLVYRWYRDRVIESDDEVSLMHGPARSGYRHQSVPLVDIRATLVEGRRVGAITEAEAAAIIAEARRRHYPDRDYPSLLEAALTDQGRRAAVASWVAEHAVDRKRLDAIELLETMAGSPVGRHRHRPPFESTWIFEQLLAEVRRIERRSGEAEDPFDGVHHRL